MQRTPTILLALAAAALALPGCVIYDEDAELRLYWEFAGARSCAEAGVVEMFVQIERADGTDYQEFTGIPCEAGFTEIPGDFATADDLEPGDHFVVIYGFPEVGGATWLAEGLIDLHGGFNEFTFGLEPF